MTNSPNPPAADPRAQAVLDAIPEDGSTNSTTDPKVFITGLGIRFKIKPVAPFLLFDSQRALKEPRPPRVPNLDKDPDGKVLEENPHDPAYLQEVQDHRQALGDLSNGIMISRGTEIIHPLPDGIEGPETDGWIEDVEEFAGITVPRTTRKRYYAWVKYVALTTMEEFTTLIQRVSAAAGMTLEVDVAAAVESFRDQPSGDTSNGVHPGEEDGRGPADSPVLPGSSS